MEGRKEKKEEERKEREGEMCWERKVQKDRKGSGAKHTETPKIPDYQPTIFHSQVEI